MRDAWRRRLLVVAIAAAAVAVDAWSKGWALQRLPRGDLAVVGDLLRFDLAMNPGAAFGSFRGGGVVFGLLAAGATIWIVWYAGRVTQPAILAGLGFLAGGALGNLVDRVARGDGFLDGHVVDFIRIPNWPTFNVADMCVFIGVALVLIGSLVRERQGDDADTDGQPGATQE